MDTSKQDRLVPAVILAASLVVGALWLWSSAGASPGRAASTATSGGAGAAASGLAELEKIIGEGHATSEVWMRYARCQESMGAFRSAAQAYEMALKSDPVNRDLLFGRGVALARAGCDEDLYSYVFQLSVRDPRLTYDLLDRQECKPYLASPRFRKIYQEAYDQYLD